jgi:hypothetical protein
LDAVLAIDNANRIAKPDNSWIAVIPLPMACGSLRDVYPSLARLWGGCLGYTFVRLWFLFHQSSKKKRPSKGPELTELLNID